MPLTTPQSNDKVLTITLFLWEGSWGPFRIKTHCGECDLTTSIIRSALAKELKGAPIALEIKPWLDNWFYCILRGGWHAPIVMIDGHVFSQGVVPNRKKLVEKIRAAFSPAHRPR